MQTVDAAGRRPASQRLAVGVVFVLALGVVVLVPMLDRLLNPGSTQPGLITYLGVGLSVLSLSGVMIYAGVRGLIPKGGVFLLSFAGYNALLIAVKFLIAPVALYQVAEARGLTVLGSDSGGFGYVGFPLLTAMLAATYGTAFFLLTWYFRSKLRQRLGVPVRLESRFVALFLAMFLLGAMAAITLGWLAGLEYILSLVYITSLAFLLAVALLGALILCTVAFTEANAQAAMLRNVTLFTGFAWVGLAFIAAYHVLWLVFVLTVITVWPLKSISVK